MTEGEEDRVRVTGRLTAQVGYAEGRCGPGGPTKVETRGVTIDVQLEPDGTAGGVITIGAAELAFTARS